ncbi:MAG TPA: alpha/beta hydrolase [Thermoanaerobaculia bacterium]|jgi:pimeloyl-ACP methyl ester carboxylesterase
MRQTRLGRLLLPAVILVLLAGGGVRAQSSAAPANAKTKPTIVLVHGAFADASSWQRVIPILQKDGYEVVAVQIPLASLAGDIEWTKRVLDAQKGPVVLVGHSYGGGVITGAAAGSAKVQALVYLAAFAPEAGEPLGAFGDKYPVALNSALRPDPAGFLYVDPAKFQEDFCADLPATDARVAAATQKPVHNSVFGASVPVAAWKTIPSWYLVSQDDHAINPDLERFYAKRMNAKTSEIKASHVAFISHPDVVAKLIEEAAAAAGDASR